VADSGEFVNTSRRPYLELRNGQIANPWVHYKKVIRTLAVSLARLSGELAERCCPAPSEQT
jgi:hypothetical protein